MPAQPGLWHLKNQDIDNKSKLLYKCSILKLFFRSIVMKSLNQMKSSIQKFTLRNVIFLIVILICSVAPAADWPNWRGPNFNGISNETGWDADWQDDEPKVLWEASLGPGFASMAVSDGKVYAMGNVDDKDILYCFDETTGDVVWKKSYDCPLLDKNHEGGPCATPTVEGDSVYTFSKDGDALRFKTSTGEIVWHVNLNKKFGFEHPRWHFSGSPLIVDDLIILNIGSSGVALKKEDGSIAWKSGKSESGYATGVLFDTGEQKSVIMPVSREIVAINPKTGDVIWRFPWKTSYDINAAEPVFSGDLIFISSGYDHGCALLKIDGTKVNEIWQNKNMRNQMSSSVLWEGHLYGFDGQVGGKGQLRCLDFKTGQIKWSQSGLGTGTLMMADGKLIILGERGKLVIAEASPDGFNELSSKQILRAKCWTVPVLANGRIYARDANGRMVCVDVSSKAEDS
jgi:outer membrane protein assembly factor BamB